MNAFGQSLLLARRLAEAGVPLITVYWPDRTEPEAFINNGVKDNVAVAAWDTHGHKVGATPNFPMLRDKNLPPLDIASSALLDDLADRRMLDQTLLVWTGEFGRSPRVNPDAGRDHYGNAFSLMLAGAGIRGGYVHGSTDKIGAYPADRPRLSRPVRRDALPRHGHPTRRRDPRRPRPAVPRRRGRPRRAAFRRLDAQATVVGARPTKPLPAQAGMVRGSG